MYLTRMAVAWSVAAGLTGTAMASPPGDGFVGCHRESPDSVVHCHVERGDEAPHPSGAITCYDFSRCTGCGCKAGPGWREPPREDGKRRECLGHEAVTRVCGDPPGAPCTHEPSEREALNRACVLERFDPEPGGVAPGE